MSLTYMCAVCGSPSVHVYSVEDTYYIMPCENQCSSQAEHFAVAQHKQDIEDEKNGIFVHDEEWCKENNYEYRG